MSRLILVALSCGILLDGAKCMEQCPNPAIQHGTPVELGTVDETYDRLTRMVNVLDEVELDTVDETYVRLTRMVNVLDEKDRNEWIVRLVVALANYMKSEVLPEVRAFEVADIDVVGPGFNKWLMQQVIVNYQELLDIDEAGELKKDDAKLQSSKTFEYHLTFKEVFNCIVNVMIKREEGIPVSSYDKQQAKTFPLLAIRWGITQVRGRTHQYVFDFFNRINGETSMSASPLMGNVQEIDHSGYEDHVRNIVNLLDEQDMDEVIVGLIIAFADYISKGDVPEVTAYEVADLSVTSPEFSHWLKDNCFRSYKKLLAIDTTGKLREVHGKLSFPGCMTGKLREVHGIRSSPCCIWYDCYPIEAWDCVVEVMKDREAYRHMRLPQKMSEEKTIDGCCLQRNPRVYPLHAIEEVIAEKKEKITKHVCDLLDNYK